LICSVEKEYEEECVAVFMYFPKLYIPSTLNTDYLL
jgi:hypothetical protein